MPFCQRCWRGHEGPCADDSHLCETCREHVATLLARRERQVGLRRWVEEWRSCGECRAQAIRYSSRDIKFRPLTKETT